MTGIRHTICLPWWLRRGKCKFFFFIPALTTNSYIRWHTIPPPLDYRMNNVRGHSSLQKVSEVGRERVCVDKVASRPVLGQSNLWKSSYRVELQN